MAADFIRGMRWRAALTIVAAVFVIATYGASVGRGYILRIDFTFVPEAIGADVVIDGETVDTLKLLRRQPVNGIRVSNGEHLVSIESKYCVGHPLTVEPTGRERSVSLFVNLQERTIDDEFVCTFELRR